MSRFMPLSEAISRKARNINGWKRILSLVLAVLFGVVCVIPASAAEYTDIPGEHHWAYDGINFVISEGLMVGTGNGTFSPQKAASRAMLAAVLYRVAGSPEVDASANFKDVPQNAWYKKAVDWAYLTGVVSGYSETAFGPYDFLTREQAVAMFYSFVKVNGYSHTGLSLLYNQDGTYETYADSDQVSQWAIPAINWSLNAGLLYGTRKENVLMLEPQGIVAREQLATILYRFDGIVKWPGKGDVVGAESNRLTVTGLLDSPTYTIRETDAALLKDLLTDESWNKTEDFLEYPAAFAIYLGNAEYLLYVKDGAWLEQCGFITTQENGEKIFGGMTLSDSAVFQRLFEICQAYTAQ